MNCWSIFASFPKTLYRFREAREKMFFFLSCCCYSLCVCCSREYNLIPAQWKQNIFFKKTQSRHTQAFCSGCYILSFSWTKKKEQFFSLSNKMRSLSLYQMKVNWLPNVKMPERRYIERERVRERKTISHYYRHDLFFTYCVCMLLSFSIYKYIRLPFSLLQWGGRNIPLAILFWIK